MNKIQRLVRLHQVVSAIDTENQRFSISDPNCCVTGYAKRDRILTKEGLSEDCIFIEDYQEFFGLTREEVLSLYVSYSYTRDRGKAAKKEALTKIQRLIADNTILVVRQRSPWTRTLPVLLFLMVLL